MLPEIIAGTVLLGAGALVLGYEQMCYETLGGIKRYRSWTFTGAGMALVTGGGFAFYVVLEGIVPQEGATLIAIGLAVGCVIAGLGFLPRRLYRFLMQKEMPWPG